MFKITINQTIGLAGLYQALALIQQIAWHGDPSHSSLVPTVKSILRLQTDSFIDAYESIDNLQLGLTTLKQTLTKRNDPRVIERTRYAINLMYLDNKLLTHTQTISRLGAQIERVDTQYSSIIEESLPELVNELGTIYRENISPLGPKIIVEGNPTYLKVEQNASMIRTLLLAGLRAISLWRHAHGKRWALLFGRQSILNNIATLEQRI